VLAALSQFYFSKKHISSSSPCNVRFYRLWYALAMSSPDARAVLARQDSFVWAVRFMVLNRAYPVPDVVRGADNAGSRMHALLDIYNDASIRDPKWLLFLLS
jgi:hypothetical protein